MVNINYEVNHIQVNDNSRPGYDLLDLQAIVVHYTANPGVGAEAHRKYFNGSIIGSDTYAGAHIFVDRYKAIEFVPLHEGTFHANDGGTAKLKLPTLRATDSRYPTRTGEGNANLLTIGIEMCLEPDGSIHPDTLERTKLVIRMLQGKYPQLRDTPNRVVKHFDVTGKACPLPFLDGRLSWSAFISDIDKATVAGEVEQNEEPKINEGVELMQPSNQSLRDSVTRVLNRLEHKENGISSKWREDFLAGKLSTSDAIALIYVALDRSLIQGNMVAESPTEPTE